MGLGESDTPTALAMFLARNPGMSAVAIADGVLVGAVLCGHDGRRGSLHHLAVVPSARGQGLAGRMLDHCDAALAASGLARCHLMIYVDNAAGQRFWEHRGWQAKPWRVMQKPI